MGCLQGGAGGILGNSTPEYCLCHVGGGQAASRPPAWSCSRSPFLFLYNFNVANEEAVWWAQANLSALQTQQPQFRSLGEPRLRPSSSVLFRPGF